VLICHECVARKKFLLFPYSSKIICLHDMIYVLSLIKKSHVLSCMCFYHGDQMMCWI